MKNNYFMAMVQDDIEKCKKVLASKQEIRPLLNELVGKYSKVSNNFPDLEMNQLLFKMHPELPLEYIQSILGFLTAYSLNDCEDYSFNNTDNQGINITANFSNNNENTINIDSFAETKRKVENMTSLTDSEINEILLRINELEKIVNSTDRKSKKWENAKEIIKWISEKSIDVGLALLPLILKLGQ